MVKLSDLLVDKSLLTLYNVTLTSQKPCKTQLQL